MCVCVCVFFLCFFFIQGLYCNVIVTSKCLLINIDLQFADIGHVAVCALRYTAVSTSVLFRLSLRPRAAEYTIGICKEKAKKPKVSK